MVTYVPGIDAFARFWNLLAVLLSKNGPGFRSRVEGFFEVAKIERKTRSVVGKLGLLYGATFWVGVTTL